MTALTRETVEAMLAMRPGPLEVRKISNGLKRGWRVVNQSGEAEIGEWELAESSWKADADAFAAMHDVLRALLAAWDRAEGLEADLDSAVEVAFKRGATEWVRLNYPKHYTRFTGDTP
jgi:hypothetical protein